MKKISLLTIALVSGFSILSNAKVSQYVSGKLSYNNMKTVFTDKEFGVEDKDFPFSDVAIGFGVGYGLDFNNGFRSDIEFTYNTDMKETILNTDVKNETMSLMLNGYYDIATGTKWTPFVNLGIGVARSVFKDESSDLKIDGNKFAYQAGVGVGYEVSQNITLDAGYKYLNLGSVDYDWEDGLGKSEIETDSDTFYVGARFAF